MITNNPENKIQKIEELIPGTKEYWKAIVEDLVEKDIEEFRKLLAERAKEGEKIEVKNPKAAGIDIGSKEHWVCVPAALDKDNVRQFGTFTCDLYEIAAWLKKCGVTTVAMESTGIYWIAPYQVIEDAGIEVCLVNAKYFKNVPGRGKTDRLDCKWLQKLHTFGLLHASFRPDAQICQIRSLLRNRRALIQMGATRTQLMQKSLEQMNIKLANVISDIVGVSGLKIIEAIIRGERNLLHLAELKDRRIKATTQELIKSLEGDYRDEHIFTLKQALDGYKFIRQQIVECDLEIEKYLQKMDKQPDPSQLTFEFVQIGKHKPRKSKVTHNEPHFDANSYILKITGVDFTEIPGISESSILTIISEIGLDMTKWKSEKEFVCWLGLCPKPDKSGGKVISSSTRKVKNRASEAFRMAALSVQRSQSYLGNFFRKIASTRGFHKAITATARKIAVIFYSMLKNKIPYKELGPDFYYQQNKEKIIRNLILKAKSLGLEVVVPDNV